MLARFVNKLKSGIGIKSQADRKVTLGYQIPAQKQAFGLRTNISLEGYFSATSCQMSVCEQMGILMVYPVSPWVYKTEVLSFYKERTETFRGNQNVRYWSYYYIHPQTGEQYQITLQDTKIHLDNWVQTREEGWELPSAEPRVGLDPIIQTVFLFDKPKRPLGR